jgi:hypothetical protein
MPSDEQDDRQLNEGLSFEITQDDMDAARAVGATGAELAEFAINRALDRMGIPREGRTVKYTAETIMIDLPPGYRLPELRAGRQIAAYRIIPRRRAARGASAGARLCDAP